MRRSSIWIYPNNEIRLRQSLAVSGQRKSGGGFAVSSPPLNLDIKREFATELVEAVKPESVQVRPGFGGPPKPTRFTTRAKRTILRVGGVMDRTGQECTFLTGTLPGSTPESMDAIARWSAYVVHDLRSWLHKRFKGDPGFGWFFVWERQERGALHLHMVVTSENKEKQNALRSDFSTWWYDTITRVSRLAGVDLAARRDGGTWADSPWVWQTNAQQCEKSVAAYCSKYCTKDSGKVGSPGDRSCYPTRWWGCCRALLHRLRGMVVSLTQLCGIRQAEFIRERIIVELSAYTVKKYQYNDKFGSGKTDVIYVRPECLDQAKEALQSLMSFDSMSIQHAPIYGKKFMPSQEYLKKIWSNTADRTAFFMELNNTNQDLVHAWANSKLAKNWISLIETVAKEWWYTNKINLSTNAQLRQRAQSGASLAEQPELRYPPPPDAKSGGMASAERDYLPPALRD